MLSLAGTPDPQPSAADDLPESAATQDQSSPAHAQAQHERRGEVGTVQVLTRPAQPDTGGQAEAGTQVVVVLTGEVDAELAPALGAAIDIVGATMSAVPVHAVIVEVAQVSFMDSSGAAFLARLVGRSHPMRVQLHHPGAAVRFLIEITQLSRILDVHPARIDPTGNDGASDDHEAHV